MLYLFFFPFALQAAVMFFDEFYFHLRRGLPRWEKIGHPLDTLSVLICYGFVLFFPYEIALVKIYIILALFSCLFVTKDEFIHKEECPASEQWLHALLFINHPLVLTLLGVAWPLYHARELPLFLIPFQSYASSIALFFRVQVVLIALFGLYQTFYWNLFRKTKPCAR